MVNHVAWSPVGNPACLHLLSIDRPAWRLIDRQQYLRLLGERIQSMIDGCPHPADAVRCLQGELRRSARLAREDPCASADAGYRLVTRNSGVWQALSELGVFDALSRRQSAPGIDDPEARQALLEDSERPEESLQAWAAQLSGVDDLLSDRFDDESLDERAEDLADESYLGRSAGGWPTAYLVPEALSLTRRLAPLLAQGGRITGIYLPPKKVEDRLSWDEIRRRVLVHRKRRELSRAPARTGDVLPASTTRVAG